MWVLTLPSCHYSRLLARFVRIVILLEEQNKLESKIKTIISLEPTSLSVVMVKLTGVKCSLKMAACAHELAYILHGLVCAHVPCRTVHTLYDCVYTACMCGCVFT